MINCCNEDLKSICSQVDCNVKETAKGIQIEITPKDDTKAGTFKAMIKTIREFCGCKC